jgi:hypothetical protein
MASGMDSRLAFFFAGLAADFVILLKGPPFLVSTAERP